MREQRQICKRGDDRRRILCTLLALLIAFTTIAGWNESAFADISPQFSGTPNVGRTHDSSIQLAEANLPPGVSGLNDYMNQRDDGPTASAVPPQAYQPQAVPPQGYYPQGVPSQEWNYGNADPNAQRSALIGAAVVGALAVGLWAWQQHEQQQNRRDAHIRRHHNRRPAFDN